MARKTLQFTVQDEGRDQGKVFLLRELSASEAERWALRAFLGAASQGIDVPEDLVHAGMAGLARFGLGFVTKLPWPVAEPLLAEMFACVLIIPNPGNPAIVRALVEDDIEEVATRVKLRLEVFKLHVGFLQAAAPSTSDSVTA